VGTQAKQKAVQEKAVQETAVPSYKRKGRYYLMPVLRFRITLMRIRIRLFTVMRIRTRWCGSGSDISPWCGCGPVDADPDPDPSFQVKAQPLIKRSKNRLIFHKFWRVANWCGSGYRLSLCCGSGSWFLFDVDPNPGSQNCCCDVYLGPPSDPYPGIVLSPGPYIEPADPDPRPDPPVW
jgi:hypothetical protein